MKIKQRMLDRVRGLLVLAVLLLSALSIGAARAQNASPPPRSTAQLEQLVAPIALYPDPLLSQVLMASTYPLEVVSAARWVQANPGVSGQALQDAMQKQPWDPSVKALTAVPQTLQMMNDKLDWTQELGDAFLAQQADVLDAVQRLRARADAAGQLKSTDQQKVTKTAASARQAPASGSGGAANLSATPATYYTIESTNPDEYYVPMYDPAVVYGAWPYPEYPPYYWYPPGWYPGTGLAFAAGIFVGSAIWGNIDWRGHRVQINPLRYNQFNRTNITNVNWNHNPAHRGSVPYRDRNVAQQFGKPGQNAAREAFRGTADAGRRQINNQLPNSKQGQNKLGQKGANHPKANTRPANTKEAGNRPASKETGAKGAKQKVQTKQAKQTSKTKEAAANRPKQTANSKQGGGNRKVAQNKSPGPRPSARPAGGRGPATIGRGGGPRGGGGMRAGGGGGRGGGGRGGGRRSDIRLKHDIALLGHLDNGLGFYRFSYNGSDKVYVGVMAQEVQSVMPEAVIRGRDGYLEVLYDRLGLPFQTYQEWIALGARVPTTVRHRY
jgi:Protein of unknown function (DUF3300)/Chaperone of endosialidase